mmetsp:Transcript_50058/g.89850  ORF Transcript_50058/g.89850 Transcript_50058/m.89850 type:complete len:317 (+) Transcript_50058:1622-2572(+)
MMPATRPMRTQKKSSQASLLSNRIWVKMMVAIKTRPPATKIPARMTHRSFSRPADLMLGKLMTTRMPTKEQKMPTPAIQKGRATRAWSPPARAPQATMEPAKDSNRSAPMPATSPTLSPTLSAMTPGLRASSSGISPSTLPTRSAPTSAALVNTPPATLANKAMLEPPAANPLRYCHTRSPLKMTYRMVRPSRPSPVTHRAITAPLLKATARPAASPLSAGLQAWAVRVLAEVAMAMPAYPAEALRKAPTTKQIAVNRPARFSWSRGTRMPMAMATTTTNRVRYMYSVCRKLLAPWCTMSPMRFMVGPPRSFCSTW